MKWLNWRWWCRHIDAPVPLALADCRVCAEAIAKDRVRELATALAILRAHRSARTQHDAAERAGKEKALRAAIDDADRSPPGPPRQPVVRGLTIDQEDDLRGIFGGAIEVAAGCRSHLGPMLLRLKYQLPQGSGGYQARHFDDNDGKPIVYMAEMPENDAEDRLIDAMAIVSRQRTIRAALSTLTRQHVRVLRTVFSPVPEQLVVGLVTAFGDHETAAVALLTVVVAAPGASRARVLRELVDRAKGDKRKKQGPSEKATADLDERRMAAKLAIRDAIAAYLAALREAQRAAREAKRKRFEALVDRARSTPS